MEFCAVYLINICVCGCDLFVVFGLYTFKAIVTFANIDICVYIYVICFGCFV